jgi:hypothetical protein
MEPSKRRDYRDLVLWQRAVELAAEVHRVTLKLPRHELFGEVGKLLNAVIRGLRHRQTPTL